MKRIEFLQSPMDISTMSDTVAHIESKISKGEFIQHVVVNVAKIVNMRKNPTLAESVRECDVINIDGMGVVFGARFLGHAVPERIAGIDLFHQLLEMSAYRGFPIFLLGATQEVVSTTNHKLHEMYPNLNIAGFHDGYFWENEEEVVNKIRESGAKLLFVAITSPKKENFISKWKDQLGVDFVMGVGGTFDVVAGKVNRAPTWMQEAGLEWLYRVLQEPRRMWKRYLVTNSKYALLLIKERIKKK